MRSRLGLISLTLMLSGAPALAQETADHPEVGRFEKSQIIDHERMNFEEYVLLTEKVTGDAEWGEPAKSKYGRTLEGTVTRITYESPREHSTLEVMRAYEEALAGNGFEILFQCDDAACGGRDFNHAVVPYGLTFSENQKDQRYLAARKARLEERDLYVGIYTVKAYSVGGERKNRVYTQVDVIEERPRDSEVVVIEAEEMSESLGAQGRVALHGIHFDLDSAAIRPESAPALDEIAQLLRENPELGLLIVGHTDNQGGFAYNIDLSKRRAASVTQALVSEYGINRARLKPWGVGYTAPMASNASAEGRATNRRVELVAD